MAVVTAVMLRPRESLRLRAEPLTVSVCQLPGPVVQEVLLVTALAPLFFCTCMVTDPPEGVSIWQEAAVIVILPIMFRK